MKHCMLDLETMGTKPHSPIITIGAVMFDEAQIYDSLELRIDLRTHPAPMLDPDTVLWWMKQSEEARKRIYEGDATLDIALDDFTIWLRRFGDRDNLRMWGNGASFDCVMLRETYGICGKTPPWEWWNDRCYRTLKNLYAGVKMSREGTAHVAVDDAADQARHLISICLQHGVKLG